MRTVYLVSCVAKKSERPSMAKDLYQSAWFKKARDFVDATGMPWFILSAKYGLVDPSAVIQPYEQTLNRMLVDARHAWADAISLAGDRRQAWFRQFAWICGAKRYRASQ